MNRKKNSAGKSKSRWKLYIAIAVATVIGGLAGVWGLLHSSPPAYRPVAAENPEEVSPYLTHRLAPDFYNGVQLNEPFEMVIEQDGVNDILSRGVWPQQFDEMTVGIPMVVFEAGTVHLMSRVDYYGLSSVLTVTARPVMDERGRLNAHIQTVRLGLLPFTDIAVRIAEKAVRDSAGDFGDWPGVEVVLRAIVANEPIEPVFEFEKQRIWVQKVAVEPGRMRVRLSPENKAVYLY